MKRMFVILGVLIMCTGAVAPEYRIVSASKGGITVYRVERFYKDIGFRPLRNFIGAGEWRTMNLETLEEAKSIMEEYKRLDITVENKHKKEQLLEEADVKHLWKPVEMEKGFEDGRSFTVSDCHSLAEAKRAGHRPERLPDVCYGIVK